MWSAWCRPLSARTALDIWVNNAGIYPPHPVLEMSEAEWDRVLDVNLRGTFLCSQAAARRMLAQATGGVILNIASIDAVHPSMVGLAHYDASKGGMLSFTRNLALELAPHNIRVLAIAPGGITTEGTRAGLGAGVDSEQVLKSFEARIPLRRMGVPDDIGRLALFLASDAAAYITGTMVFVDCGVLLT
jgi:2-dehydro-3-deoxy-D-gluconate 5-dehydrogenase